MLVAMIGSATPLDGGTEVSDGDRARWLAQAPATRAGRRCGCRRCPSVELTDDARSTASTEPGRVVLGAGVPGALLLFVDDDRPGHLELAPLCDTELHRFPAVEDITFG